MFKRKGFWTGCDTWYSYIPEEQLKEKELEDDYILYAHLHKECSVCHKVRVVDKYCSNCGAKMNDC